MGAQWPDVANRTTDHPLNQRIALMERQIIDYQHKLDEWQVAYTSLRQQFIEATGREPR